MHIFLLQVILDIVAVIGFSSILEPLWSIKEFLVGLQSKLAFHSVLLGGPLKLIFHSPSSLPPSLSSSLSPSLPPSLPRSLPYPSLSYIFSCLVLPGSKNLSPLMLFILSVSAVLLCRECDEPLHWCTPLNDPLRCAAVLAVPVR